MDLEYFKKHGHNQIKICVSGAAETGNCGIGALDLAKELGREIARQGAILITGATTGFPLWAAMGVKEEGGISIGISPAASEREHVEVYKLPLDYMDLIIYTGFGYPGRDILLTRSSDAVICGCGRIGTIHEFTVAFEDGKPIGIFEGPWDMGKELEQIIEKGHRPNAKIAKGKDAKKLLQDVLALVKVDKISEFKAHKDSASDTN
ncbi:LOG family protein [Candidatus Nomurabacteria bacterium]|nr:LOG family protein [Candidatus Nomurabacteria bacterium]